LKCFAQDDVAHADGLLTQGDVQKIGLGRESTAEVVDPDGRINDPHA
jgi:hypothetical protein